MNRTIRFRGKNLYNNEWIFGDLIQYESGEMAIFSKKLSQYGCEATEMFNRSKVIPETVGQFTGLLDKNGKEIYEGDIVERIVHQNPCFGFIGNVVFDSNIALFCVEHNKFGSNSRTPFVMPDDWMDKYSNRLECEFEIKGNIYDHPELIKKE